MPESQKLLTRRHLLTLAGGAAGVAIAGKAVASTLGRPSAARKAGHPQPVGAHPGKAAGDKLTASRANAAPSAPVAPASAPVTPPAAPQSVSAVADRGTERHFTVKKASPSPRGPVMRPLVVPPAGEAVAALFGGTGAGTLLGSCRVVRVHDVYLGAVPVVLETADRRRFQLDVLKHSPGAQGVAGTSQVSIFLANQGSGRSPTNEEQGRAALALAQVLARASRVTVPRGLLTLRQRRARFPRGSFAIPLTDA